MREKKPKKRVGVLKTSKQNLGSIDIWLFITIMMLLAIGVVMVYSASSYFSMLETKDSAAIFKKQLLWAVIGICAMLVTSKIDYHKYNNKKFVYPLYAITVVLLLAVFAFPPIKGATRWIRIPGMSFQPSELAKYAIVLFLGYFLMKKGNKIKEFGMGVIPALMYAGIFAAIILKQKNLSIATITMLVAFTMIYISGAKKTHMFGMVAPTLGFAALAFTLGEGYRRARMLNFLDPWKDPAGNGYQLIQSLYALGSGGITGLGLGQSRQKTLYMPEPHNDFIFSIIGEELGLIGCLVIIGLFIFFICRGVRIALNARDKYGCLIAIGITAIVGIQCVINIAVVTGSMPVTGVPLPFISYGGSATVVNLMAMGILLNISRQGKKEIM